VIGWTIFCISIHEIECVVGGIVGIDLKELLGRVAVLLAIGLVVGVLEAIVAQLEDRTQSDAKVGAIVLVRAVPNSVARYAVEVIIPLPQCAGIARRKVAFFSSTASACALVRRARSAVTLVMADSPPRPVASLRRWAQ